MMHPRPMVLMTILLVGIPTLTLAALPDESSIQQPADKVLVTDGHVRHDLGRLQNHVSNFGLIGSRPTATSPFSASPSARWPGANGDDYLFAAGFWVGGQVLGEPLVSTGQYLFEIMASPAPGDTIFATFQGAVGGTRYPWAGADDDGDGLEDEDPLDGLDNDNDGRTDEDYAAIGDQDYRSAMSDTTAMARNLFPDHTPLNIAVVQRSYQWGDPQAADFIGYEYTVTNVGVTPIDDFLCGMFTDFDIGNPSDDLAGGFAGSVQSFNGTPVPVSLTYVHEGGPSILNGWAGWVMCGLSTDAQTPTGQDMLAMPTHQIFMGNSAYEQGGDPTNDAERFDAMTSGIWDPNPVPGMTGDYRQLIAAPAVPVLAPGETVTFRVALVIGGSFDEMLTVAAEAVLTARGASFDRDGDPGNGDEFHVPWIRPGNIPVAAITGHLSAVETSAAGVELVWDSNHSQGSNLAVVRRATRHMGERRWRSLVDTDRVVDDDAVGWPRTYDLVLEHAGAEDLLLDTMVVEGPPVVSLSLEAVPNPFNPRVTFRFTISEPGTGSLSVHDLRGRVIRRLIVGESMAGPIEAVWNGVDEGGQAVASGVYVARLVVGARIVERSVSLIR